MTQDSNEATFSSVIRDQIETRLKQLHTCTPGLIESFDTATGRAEIQPTVERVLHNGDLIPLPKLINCPVGNLRAGGFTVTMPVKAGDECMIHFTERSIDAWIKFGDIRKPNDLRLHHESDAYFVPVYTSEPNAIENYDPDNLVIRNEADTQKIVLQTNGDIIIATSGSAVVNASEAIVNTDGDTTINANGDCNINGTTINNNGTAAGVVTTLSINPVTGTPFPDGSTTLRNSDG